MVNGALTRAAIILLGKPEADIHLRPSNAQITYVLYDKDKIEKDYEHFAPPYILSVDKIYSRIRNLKYRYMTDGTLFPEEIDQYSLQNIRESLNNCIAHMDYTIGGRITVSEREDSYLSFANPGTFLPGSIEKVISTDEPPHYNRNALLALTMVSLNMIDSIGSGIKRMFKVQRDRFFPMPDYDFSDNRVKVTLIGKLLDPVYAKVLAQHHELSLEEIIMLDKVQKKKALSDEEARHLKEKGLIDGRKPNFHISAMLAASTGQTVDYMKSKGVDDAFIQKTVIDYLKKFGKAKREIFEDIMLSKLSDSLTAAQKANRIKNALQAMKREGKIENNGKFWFLSENV